MNWKIISFLFVFVALHCRANGGKKSGVKVVNLQRKLHQKIFHQHHHHYHSHHHDNNHHQHHHPHHPHNHDGQKHPSHQHHHHNLHHHNPIKHYLHHHHNHVHHPHHHQHHHHHHHHHHHTNHRNPIQHYHHQDHHPKHQHHHQHHHPHHQDLGHRHHHHHHHHHHPHNVHHQPKPKVPPTKKPVHIQQHLVNRTSNISHRPNSSTSSKLQLHVQIQNVQAVKRDSLPNLLSTLGKNLMELGTSMSPKKSKVPVNSTDGLEQKENATAAFPIPQFSFAAEGLSSSSAAIPASSHQVKVSSVDLQMLLHKALDGENDDYVESGSGSGSGDRQNDTEDSISNTSTTKNEPIHYQNQSSTEDSERRNQTFPGERDHYPPDGLDNYSNENETHDTQNTYGQATDELVQRNTEEAHLDGRSNSQFAQGGRNASSEEEGLEDNDQSDQSQTSPFQEMFENGTSSESSPVTNQTLLDETKRPDTNASFYDSEGIVEKGNENSGLKHPEKHATEQHVSQNTKELEEDDAGVSGDQGSSESGENIDENLEDEEGYHHISYQGEANERGLSNATITGNDEGGSVVDEESGSAENTHTYGFGNATYSDSEEEIDINKAAEMESTEEDESQVREEEISKNVTVNFSRNPVFPENQSEPSVHQIRAKKLNSGDSVGSINETEEEGLFDSASEIGIRNKTDGESERDVYTTKAKKAEAIDKSKSPVQEEHIGKPATVNLAGNNAISENQSYPSFDQVRSKKSNSEGIVDTINATDDRLLDHALLNEFNQSADANELTQGFSATNAYVPSNEEMERPLSQPLINSSTFVTSDESFDQIRTNKTSSKDFDYSGNLQDSRLDHGVLKETNLSYNAVGLTQGFAAKEGYKFSHKEFEPPTTHPLLDDSTRGILEAHGEKGAEPEGSDPSTYHVDIYDRQNDVDIPDKPENTTLYENDEASVGQEPMEEGISKQDQRLQIDNTTLPEGPLSAHSYSSSVDTEGTQLTDAQLTTSPDNSTTDETDDIPVYTVSMPSKVDSVGRDSTADDKLQSRVSEAPISSFNTPSALAYSEQSTLPREEESMFNVLNQTVKEDFGYNPQPTQRVVFQRDMLDDPVEESLDSTVDSS